MLRPNDSIESKRRLIVQSFASQRGSLLREAKKELGLPARATATQVGWAAAFQEYPWKEEIVDREGEITTLRDIEEGIDSLAELLIQQSPAEEASVLLLHGGTRSYLTVEQAVDLRSRIGEISLTARGTTRVSDVDQLVMSTFLWDVQKVVQRLIRGEAAEITCILLGELADVPLRDLVSAGLMVDRLTGADSGSRSIRENLAQEVAQRLSLRGSGPWPLGRLEQFSLRELLAADQ